MPELATFKGEYAGLKFLPSRSVCAIIIEIPIEQGAEFVARFGTPLPGSTAPVAIARLDLTAKPETTETEKTKRQWDELSIAQQAGILCNEKRFQVFVGERLKRSDVTVDDAAQYVRQQCGVNSRAHIEGKPEAMRIFRDLDASYRGWLNA